MDPLRGFVVTPDGQDNFTLKLMTPLVHSLGDQVTIEFKVRPDSYFNATRCAQFSKVVFNGENCLKPQQVNMSFGDYGCCTYEITANGGGYDWQYSAQTFAVYACNGQVGKDCTPTWNR